MRPNQISEKTLHLIESPSECFEIGKNGKINVQKFFSITKMVLETEKLYEKILEN